MYFFNLCSYNNSKPSYEWDERKAKLNWLKHGVDFSQTEFFEWDRALVVADSRRPYSEPRWIAHGPIRSRLHVLVYTPRFRRVRVISLRRGNQREFNHYVVKTDQA